MLKIVICDDEKVQIFRIKKMIENIYDSADIIFFDNGKDCTEHIINNRNTDIYLIDICISKDKSENGLKLAETIRQYDKDALIIFISAYSEYVFKAFDVYAFNYLLKPIEEKRFTEVFLKAVNVAESRKSKNTLIVRKNSIVTKVDTDSIYYIENYGRKIILHFAESSMEYYGKFSEVEKEVNSRFFKCHRSYIVNLGKIKRYDKTELLLENNIGVPVSKYKYNDFTAAYSRFLRGEPLWHSSL